jgi:hypothetical protein
MNKGRTPEPSAYACKPARTTTQPLSGDAARRMKEAMVAPAKTPSPAALEAAERYRRLTRP